MEWRESNLVARGWGKGGWWDVENGMSVNQFRRCWMGRFWVRMGSWERLYGMCERLECSRTYLEEEVRCLNAVDSMWNYFRDCQWGNSGLKLDLNGIDSSGRLYDMKEQNMGILTWKKLDAQMQWNPWEPVLNRGWSRMGLYEILWCEGVEYGHT